MDISHFRIGDLVEGPHGGPGIITVLNVHGDVTIDTADENGEHEGTAYRYWTFQADQVKRIRIRRPAQRKTDDART